MSVDDRLHELGIVLGDPLPSVGNYIGAVTVGNLVFLSGHGPRETEEPVEGKVGETLTLEQGQQAVRNAGLNMLATLKAEIENLDRVRRVVKVLGMVNAVPDFREHPKVINGFSDLMTMSRVVALRP
jgi:enamine deaminase RidA (YjgF/YER057c/UK114 family)